MSESGSSLDEEYENHKRKRSHEKVKSKKKKKSGVNQFIEEEADDEEEEDEDDYGGHGDDLTAAELEAARIYDRNRKMQENSGVTAEDIVNRIKQRHEQSQRRYDEDGDEEGDVMQSQVAQQSLLPSVGDPKLWIFKCKPGREQHLVVSMMNKYIDHMHKKTPLKIKSVIASSTKGFIYVEAERENHAKDAIQGIRDISHWSMKLVPIHEMSSVISIKARKKPITAGSWARYKRAGLLKNDLCKVVEVFDSGTRALIQIIPRLDAVALAGGMRQPLGKGQRLPQKLFNPSVVQGEIQRKRHPMTGEMMDVFDHEFYKDGFLMKELNISSMLITEGVVPSLDEMQRFQQGMNDEESSAAMNLNSDQAWSKAVELVKGDTVRVIQGELKNLLGVVVGSNPGTDTIKVMPLHEEIRDTILDFQLKDLIKYVKVGDHVKVMCGRYSGETGTVVNVDDSEGVPIAIILADSVAKEIQVHVRDVQESAEVSTGLDSLKGKELYDMVALQHGDVGVITHVGRDQFKVILQTGVARDVTDQEIQRKLQSSRSAALDNQKNHISPGEMVGVIEGPHQGQSGTIKHIYRSFLFLHNNQIASNAGIFVAKSRKVVLSGSKARSNIAQSSVVTTNVRPQRSRREESEFMGKTVKIKRGRHKGYIGMVVEETDVKVKVEIHCKSSCVLVDKQHIMIAGTRQGHIQDNPLSSATPMVGATPLPSQTPLHNGSMTPMHTPLHHSGSTPFTPSNESWNPASTPLVDNKHEMAAYGTPVEPITPAQGNIATPGFYQPTTPGNLSYSPAPHGPVTPGMGYNPITPGISTPGGFAPVTPLGIGSPMAPVTPMEAPSSPYNAENPPPLQNEGKNKNTWVTNDIAVKINNDVEGIIRSIQPDGVCIVDTGDQRLRVEEINLSLIVPQKHDRIKILHGEEAGQTGSLIGTDGDDGIVKMDDEDSEINIYLLSNLAKLL